MSYGLGVSYGFLVDMDGVIYRGSEVMPGAQTFVARLLSERIPFLFLTNNSQRTRRDVATRLNRMGFEVTPDHVFTCAMATARYLARIKPKGTAYVIGEGGLLAALHENGYSIVDSDPDFVVIGEGRTVTMEMVDRAVTLVSRGAKLIATNLDPNCPTSEGGIRAGCEGTGLQTCSPGRQEVARDADRDGPFGHHASFPTDASVSRPDSPRRQVRRSKAAGANSANSGLVFG